MVDLGTLGGSSSGAVAVNDSDQVVGSSLIAADGETDAFSWTAAGGMVDLSLGGGLSQATGVNDQGEVTGYALVPDGSFHVFSWTQSGGMVDLGTLGGTDSEQGCCAPGAIDDAGQIVGESTPVLGSEDEDAFLWSQGAMIDLGILPGGRAVRPSPWSIRRPGGRQSSIDQTTSNTDAFAWPSQTGMQDLGPGYASAVSGTGEVVGSTEGSVPAGFAWTQAGGMENLGALAPGNATHPASVNDSGEVVGQAGIGGFDHAFAWTHAHGITDLGTLGGDNSDANQVNAEGEIVGDAELADGTLRAAVWQPAAATVPDAPANVVAAAGDTDAAVFWARPSDRGSALEHYTITASPGGAVTTVDASQTSALVTGLTNGTSYTFTVTASNALGAGGSSDPSGTVTPQAGAPVPVAVSGYLYAPGGTVSTDPTGTGPTTQVPVTTSVNIGEAGFVSVAEGAVTATPPAGVSFLGEQVAISAPAAPVFVPPHPTETAIIFTVAPALVQTAVAGSLDVYRTDASGGMTALTACNQHQRSYPLPDPCLVATSTQS